jgi:hypothetical protein
MSHRNSRTVTIFRAGSFLSRAQGKDIEDFFATSKKSIGSYWENVSSKKVASGLSFVEEAILLPHLVDATADDREFRKKVTSFYVDIDTQIPHNTGRVLEIGLLLDNDKDVSFDPKDPSKSNMPINLMDYVRYRHAIKHPYVAPNKEEADGNALIEFYIFDKTEVVKKNTKKSDEKDAAMQIYLTIKPEPTKVTMMLTLLGIDPREFTGANAEDLRIEALRKQSETNSKVFIETYNNTDLETHYWIKTMVNTGVMKIIGNKYFDAETNKLIGNTLEETTFFFKDEENSDVVVSLKARMQEGLKKPVNKKPR